MKIEKLIVPIWKSICEKVTITLNENLHYNNSGLA